MLGRANSNLFGRLFLLICLSLIIGVLLIGQSEADDFSTTPDIVATHSVYLPMVLNPLSVPTSSPIISNKTFLETFDGAPSTPTAWTDENWNVTVHLRDNSVLYEMYEMDAHHGSGCEGPPATHKITSYDDTVYQCRDHVMTSLYGISDTGGYGLIYLTPNQIIDASGNWSIHFDMSTFRANNVRDWVDIWLTPYDENMQLTIHEFGPDLQGPPHTAIQFRLDQNDRLDLLFHENGTETKLTPTTFVEYDTVLTPSKSVRSTFVVAVYNEILYAGLPDHDLWWHLRDVPDFMRGDHWKQTVVQFGHHSYTPDKSCHLSDNPTDCGPNTYHWDNIALWPSTPFTMIHTSPKLITSSTPTSKVLTLESPAPSGAKLRFAGIGDSIEVSFNGGTTWTDAAVQSSPSGQTRNFFKSYWADIPEGTEEVLFRGEDWTNFGVWAGEWAVRDATVWSLETSARAITAKDDASAKRVAAFLDLKATSDVMTCAIPSE